jgi:hypothetical protein
VEVDQSRRGYQSARGGTRTHKPLPAADFESAVFAISPPGRGRCSKL